jgi:diguanylate cyclase (GGDEF)-like protein
MPLTKLQRLVPGLYRVARSQVDSAPKPLAAPPVLAHAAGHGEPVHDPRACDELIDSVKSSLWGLIDAPVDTDPDAPVRDGLGRVRSAALQGALALDQLQLTLSKEFAARAQLEQEIGEARAALERARAELAGTRAQALQARYLASHDALTRLPNRAFFMERLAQGLGAKVPARQGLAVLFLDLDGFKPINDTHGHAAGDELLRVVATRLARAVREDDTVSRLGGDEFACLLNGLATAEHAVASAMKLRDAIRMPCRIGDRLVQVGVSIGVSLCPVDGTTSEELLLKADMAMYRAKRASAGVALYGDGG